MYNQRDRKADRKNDKKLSQNICRKAINALTLHSQNSNIRGVAQPGLEYASGGRVVASSNLVTPTLKAGIFVRLSIFFAIIPQFNAKIFPRYYFIINWDIFFILKGGASLILHRKK